MPTLETDRLRLRMFTEADLDAYAEMVGDAEVMRHINPTMTRNEAWRHMALVLGHWQLRGFGLWAIEEKASGALVGRTGCWCPEGWPGFEVGWMLRRGWWGRGYASEAGRAVLDFAFRDLGRPHVLSVIRPGNERSIRVAERLGERLEGAAVVMGVDVLLYGIGREEWLAGS